MNIIQIHLTNSCNLSCKYCYIHQDDKKMTYDIFLQQSKYMNQLSHILDDNFDDTYSINYFGGEPLLCIDDMIKINQYIIKHFNVVNSYMQTNGMLLNDNIVKLLKDNDIDFNVSCDGINDKNYQSFINNVQHKYIHVKPKIMIDNYTCNDITNNFKSFYKLAMKNQDVYLYLDFSFVKDDIWDSKSLSIIKNQISMLIDELIYLYKNHYFVRIGFVERILLNILQKKRKFMCFAGHHGFSLTPDGIIYPCSRFYTNDKLWLCNSMTGEINYDNISFIKKYNNTDNQQCMTCTLNNVCNEGCLYSQLESGNFMHSNIVHSYCELLKIIYHEVTRLYLTMLNDYGIDIYSLLIEKEETG